MIPCGHDYGQPPVAHCNYCKLRDIPFHKDRWTGLGVADRPPYTIKLSYCQARGVWDWAVKAADGFTMATGSEKDEQEARAEANATFDELMPQPILRPWSIRFDQHNLAVGLKGLRFNASILAWKDGYLLAFRDGWAGSEIHVAKLDTYFRPTGDKAVKLKLDVPGALYGREDPRLFVFRGQLHVGFVGVENDSGGMHTNVLYARLSNDLQVKHVYYPKLPNRMGWEKSWAFFEHDCELHAVYHPTGHRIIRIDDDKAYVVSTTATPAPWSGGEIRGGAVPVRVGDEYYHWFHSKTGPDVKPTYEYGLYTFSAKPPFQPLRITPDPLVVADVRTKPADQYCPVVFPCGAVRCGPAWVVSMGVHDRWIELHRFDVADIESRLVRVAETPPVTM